MGLGEIDIASPGLAFVGVFETLLSVFGFVGCGGSFVFIVRFPLGGDLRVLLVTVGV